MSRPLKHSDGHGGPECGAVLHRDGIILVGADHGPNTPPDPRFPCWLVVCGHNRVNGRKWLTGREVNYLGGFEPVGNLHDLIAPAVGQPLRQAV